MICNGNGTHTHIPFLKTVWFWGQSDPDSFQAFYSWHQDGTYSGTTVWACGGVHVEALAVFWCLGFKSHTQKCDNIGLSTSTSSMKLQSLVKRCHRHNDDYVDYHHNEVIWSSESYWGDLIIGIIMRWFDHQNHNEVIWPSESEWGDVRTLAGHSPASGVVTAWLALSPAPIEAIRAMGNHYQYWFSMKMRKKHHSVQSVPSVTNYYYY